MNRRALLIVLAAFSIPKVKAEPRFPLLGLWRITDVYAADGRRMTSRDEIEMEFLPEGLMYFVGTQPDKGITSPIRVKSRYTFQAPDIVVYALVGGLPEQRKRITFTDEGVVLEDVNRSGKAWLRRLEATEFAETPRDVEPPQR